MSCQRSQSVRRPTHPRPSSPVYFTLRERVREGGRGSEGEGGAGQKQGKRKGGREEGVRNRKEGERREREREERERGGGGCVGHLLYMCVCVWCVYSILTQVVPLG